MRTEKRKRFKNIVSFLTGQGGQGSSFVPHWISVTGDCCSYLGGEEKKGKENNSISIKLIPL